eukprot:763612-Hanusia_phi.AAC.17
MEAIVVMGYHHYLPHYPHRSWLTTPTTPTPWDFLLILLIDAGVLRPPSGPPPPSLAREVNPLRFLSPPPPSPPSLLPCYPPLFPRKLLSDSL